MAKWYFDTPVLVAASVTEHEHNFRAKSILNELQDDQHMGYMSAHSLTEVYSVLTRVPFTPRVYPADAMRAIEERILSRMTLVSLDETEYVEVVRRAAREGWIGGRIHDAIHVQCAAKSNCDRIYTFNLRDFRAIAPPDLAPRIPAP